MTTVKKVFGPQVRKERAMTTLAQLDEQFRELNEMYDRLKLWKYTDALPRGVTRVVQPNQPDENRTALSAEIHRRVIERMKMGNGDLSYTDCLQAVLDEDESLSAAYRGYALKEGEWRST